MKSSLIIYIVFYLVFSNILFNEPEKEYIPTPKIKVGANHYKVGKDSVLVVQGKFVKEIHGVVYIKIN